MAHIRTGSRIFCLLILFIQAQAGADTNVYTWYDGQEKRQIQMYSDLIAEFDFEDSEKVISPINKNSLGDSLFNEGPSGTQIHSRPSRSVRIWKLPRKSNLKSALQQFESQEPSRKLSPVFTDGVDGSGGMRALPGHVIVVLPLDWDTEKIRTWTEKHHLKVIRSLVGQSHTLLIETGPGLESLRLANRLYRSGEVVSASPNWWREMGLR